MALSPSELQTSPSEQSSERHHAAGETSVHHPGSPLWTSSQVFFVSGASLPGPALLLPAPLQDGGLHEAATADSSR